MAVELASFWLHGRAEHISELGRQAAHGLPSVAAVSLEPLADPDRFRGVKLHPL